MSKETVKKFYEALKGDKAMVEELQKQADSVKEKSPENAAALVVKFAAAKGYDFTAGDLKAFETEAQELNQKDLDKVNAAAGFCTLVGEGSLGLKPVPGIHGIEFTVALWMLYVSFFIN